MRETPTRGRLLGAVLGALRRDLRPCRVPHSSPDGARRSRWVSSVSRSLVPRFADGGEVTWVAPRTGRGVADPLHGDPEASAVPLVEGGLDERTGSPQGGVEGVVPREFS